ncbi:Oar protein [Acidisarcina polymorpha]|uniref:Oar protein n=1 Tax=Acidisarcina polymorpha TaxID=2211140 RepID=A0A2Z5FUV3_9BACT|nr:TonB-dependent receptor [Acidisarcina polymorpha]AXC10530.1 Oar protein [Acidisarcina polymorpha]
MRKKLSAALAVCLGMLCMFCLPTASHAQAVFGSIFGSVTDNTGAAIPGATVTVTDEAKGTAVTTQSGSSGEYSVEHLIPDTYDVKVTFQGFQTSETKGIQVFADTSPKVDVKLTVGGESTTVEVNADSVPVLKTDKADVSTIFTSKTISDLPVGDRNFTNIQLLLPGAQPLGWSHAADENPQASRQIQVDGQAFGGVAYELDGTDNQDPILGIIVINPPIEAISDTKITTQNFDAEFGKAVSSIVTAQTKSGTNSFHGSAFDYRESNANLARDPYSQFPTAAHPGTDGLIPAGLKNQFGGSIGGPVIKDRLFFFGDYQGLRQKVGTSNTVTVPSALLVSTCLGQTIGASGIPGCDFSEYAANVTPTGAGIVYQQPNATNGLTAPTPYPGNVIPAALISPQTQGLLKLLQPYAPNSAGSFNGLKNNYSASGTGIFNSNAWDERVDFTLSEKIHLFERFSRFTDTLSGTTIFGAAGGAGFGIGGYGGNSTGANDSVAAGADFAISSTLLTDVRLGYYRYNIIDSKYNQGVPFADNLGIPGMNIAGQPITSGAPGFNVTEVGSSGGPNNSQDQGPQYGAGLNVNRCNCPLEEREDQFQVVNNWTKIIKNHTVKFGADLRYARNLRVPSDSDRTGLINFGTGPTSDPNAATQGGLGFGALVLGQATEYTRYVSTSTNAKEFQKRFFFYGEDSWRVTNNLTLNLGLRLEEYFPEAVNGKGNGALLNFNNGTTDGYLRVAGYGKIGSNLGWSRASYPFNPRIGVAYQLDPKTVIRSGYGRSFDLGVFGSIFGHVVTQNLPVLAAQDITTTSGATGYAFCLGPDTPGCAQPANQPAGGGPIANAFPTVPADGLLPSPGYQVSAKARPSGLRLPTIDAWNLSVQHAVTPTLSITVAYVGNKGTHTLSAGDGNNTNPNEPGITLPAQYSITGQPLHYDPSVTTGIAANGGTGNALLLRRFYGGSVAACQDPLYTPQPGVPAGSCGWSNGISYYGDDQDSHYNALQINMDKQFTKGLSFTGNYSWQQGIDFNSNYATWDRRAVRGRNNDIRQQQLIAYGVYELPIGRNQKFASNIPGWANEIIGGWQVSPVLNWSSGLPFTLTYNECSASIPVNNGGDAPCYVNGHGNWLPINLSSFDPVNHRRTLFRGTSTPLTTASYLGFTAPGLDQIGNGGRNTAFGPHFFNTDISLQKNFPIRESLVAQFRVDGYNAFNHINGNFGGGGATQAIDGGDTGTGNVYVTSSTANFGQGPRLLQFSVRVQF